MREMTISLGGDELTLAATFAASMEVADKVADPLLIAREAHLDALLPSYDPKFKLTLATTVAILHIGAKAGGSEKSREEIGELAFEEGLGNAKNIALEYLAIILGPKPEVDLDTDGEGEGTGKKLYGPTL